MDTYSNMDTYQGRELQIYKLPPLVQKRILNGCDVCGKGGNMNQYRILHLMDQK